MVNRWILDMYIYIASKTRDQEETSDPHSACEECGCAPDPKLAACWTLQWECYYLRLFNPGISG